jgi:Holliday junction resolvase RusA-like endonuclease
MIYRINDIPPSNNKYIGRDDRWKYQEVKKDWQNLIHILCRPKPKNPLQKATVKITYHFKDDRRRDPDNYSGKFILDGLVRAGILADDSFDCITLVLCKGQKDTKNPHTIIEVTEVQ